MKLTLDTNVLRDYLDGRAGQEQTRSILEAHRTGLWHVAVISRVLGDARNKGVPVSELQSRLNELFAEYEIDQLSASDRLDESVLGVDFLVDEAWKQVEQRLLDQIWPGAKHGTEKHSRRLRDIDHLLSHRYHGRDFFCDTRQANPRERGCATAGIRN
jgi:hypothetical protein